jgi:hypothetical protein
MPHYESLERGVWEKACELAGVRLIDPTRDVLEIIAELRATRLLITEAMHGAIVADALRVPWIAALPIDQRHHRKWKDWSGALDMTVCHQSLRPTNILEYYVTKSGGRGSPTGRAGRFASTGLGRSIDAVMTHRAAKHLQKLSRCEPQLSSDRKIEEVTDRALSQVHMFAEARRRVVA